MFLINLLFLILSFPVAGSGHISGPGIERTPGMPVSNDIENFSTELFGSIISDVPKPDYEVFKMALTGFLNLKVEGRIEKNMLTIIDFSISSLKDRMWIIDMEKMKVVYLTLVAHGRNSGDEYAERFSNTPASYQSSLGFYLTGSTYIGKHGRSLYLDGVETGINDNARDRSIVMHGADYVSSDFIQHYGRLGRSFGCPSIPLGSHEKIITLLAGRSCIYIHYPDKAYQKTSRLLAWGSAIKGISLLSNEVAGIMDNRNGINSVSGSE